METLNPVLLLEEEPWKRTPAPEVNVVRSTLTGAAETRGTIKPSTTSKKKSACSNLKYKCGLDVGCVENGWVAACPCAHAMKRNEIFKNHLYTLLPMQEVVYERREATVQAVLAVFAEGCIEVARNGSRIQIIRICFGR